MSYGFENSLNRIPRTRQNAMRMQQLTLQDAEAAGFPNPLAVADPNNRAMVTAQLDKLIHHPERYGGFWYDDQLVGYVKQGLWRAADELPYAHGMKADALKLVRSLKLNPSLGQWGIFGLVVQDSLPEDVRKYALWSLLGDAIVNGWRYRPINLVMHDRDPLIPVAKWYGFLPVGMPREASGAPGILQQRYQFRTMSS